MWYYHEFQLPTCELIITPRLLALLPFAALPPPCMALARQQNPAWCSDFKHVFWSQHCTILSNAPHSILPPEGSGLDLDVEQPFHLGLLRERIWGRDDFWYIALLPRHITFTDDPAFAPLSVRFDDLPINLTGNGSWLFDPDLTVSTTYPLS